MFYKVEYPILGDLVRVERKAGYYHFGIATSENTIVHFTASSGDTSSNVNDISIKETPMYAFQQDDVIEVERNLVSPYSREERVDRARKHLGQTKFRGMSYDILTNNCEHFARYIYSGVASSEQVNNGVKLAGTLIEAFAYNVITSIKPKKKQTPVTGPLEKVDK